MKLGTIVALTLGGLSLALAGAGAAALYVSRKQLAAPAPAPALPPALVGAAERGAVSTIAGDVVDAALVGL